MTGMHREHGVQGTRPNQALLRCVLLGPPDFPTPPDLLHSIEARGGTVIRPTDEYAALAHLIQLHETSDAKPGPLVLLLLEPDLHADRCAQLARALQIYAPRVVAWQHARAATPTLSAYQPPAEPDESQLIEETREAVRAEQSPYEKAVRASAAPSLRLVIDEDTPPQSTPDQDEDDDRQSDGLLSADEIEMLMDPLFETKPRRGGDQR